MVDGGKYGEWMDGGVGRVVEMLMSFDNVKLVDVGIVLVTMVVVDVVVDVTNDVFVKIEERRWLSVVDWLVFGVGIVESS